MWVAFGGNMTREDFGMLVGEITDDEKKKADEEIREQQKQIDYDTKDYGGFYDFDAWYNYGWLIGTIC